MFYTKLAVFDFDKTLFLSPEKPTWWEGGWWGNLNSLHTPCVPERPSSDWWNESVVNAAKQAISNPEVLAVLLTGRIPKFSLRLKELLGQVGLHFDHPPYMATGGPTESFKMKVIKDLLDSNPTIRGVAIWEDRANHLRMMSDWVESNGRACTPHLITVSSHESDCRPTKSAKFKSKKKIKTKDGDDTTVYEYSERQVSNRNNQKAERVEKLRKDISSLRSKVNKDIASKEPETRLSALAVALLDETCERVGNSGSAADGHFGVTGWLVKHLSFKGGEATFTYVGKSGVKHEKVVSKAPVVKALKQLVKGKAKGDLILEQDGFSVKSEAVNAYLKTFEITAKDIRGFRANQEMCKALREARREGPDLPHARKKRDEILKGEFKDALEEVAEIVGHTTSILRESYLVPGLEDSYVKDGTILATFKGASLEHEATKTDSEKEDETVSDLIKPNPKKKPPREDLKKHRVDLGDDDLNTEDDDLSRNYKKVAVRVAMAVRVSTRYLLSDFAEDYEKSKSDENETSKKEDASFLEAVEGKTFTSSKSKLKVQFGSLPPEDQAEIRAAWKEHQSKSDDKAKTEKEDSDEEEQGRVKEVKGGLREKAKALEDSPAFDDETGDQVGEVLDSILSTMPESDASEFVDSIVSARDAGIDSLAKGKSTAKNPPDKASLDRDVSKYNKLDSKIESYQRDLDSGRVSEEKAKSIKSKIESLSKDRDEARAELQKSFTKFYTHAALQSAMRNPMTYVKDAKKPLDKSSVGDRASASIERFSGLTSEDRVETAKNFKKVMKKSQDRVTELERKLTSGEAGDEDQRAKDQAELEETKNRVEYLDADWRSLEISSIINGDEKSESRIPKGSGVLIKALHDSGQDVSEIVAAGIGIHGVPPEKEVISNLLRRMKPDQMETALKEVDPSGKLAESWRKIYDADDSSDYVWPISAIKDKEQRGKIENAHDVFVQMLTGVVIEDSKNTSPTDPSEGPPKKNKSKAEPSEVEGPEEEETPQYESPMAEAIGKMVDLDIDTGTSAKKVAAKFTAFQLENKAKEASLKAERALASVGLTKQDIGPYMLSASEIYTRAAELSVKFGFKQERLVHAIKFYQENATKGERLMGLAVKSRFGEYGRGESEIRV
jgi:DNA topoisomerase IB